MRGTVTWTESNPGKWTGEVNGDIAATVERTEIKDPVTLAAQYPDVLPQSRYIDGD